MERIETINRERVKWCCREHGVTVSQLAFDTGVSLKTLTTFMDEGGGLTFLQLRKIADYFGRGVLFFLDAEPVNEAAVHTVQYRTLASQKPELSFAVKKLIERVERQRELYLSLREEIKSEDYPAFAPPQVSRNDPAGAAKVARKWLAIGAARSFDDYRRAVEAKGILVFRSNGYAGKWQIAKENPILGFNLYDQRCPVIVVKKARWETQQTFTLMHELGHLLLHRTSSIDDANDLAAPDGKEREANAFAGHLLVPDERLVQIRDSDRPDHVQYYDDWLKPQRTQWGVSGEVILRRLLDCGRLSQSDYLAYRLHIRSLPLPEESSGSRSYRYREPRHIFGEPFVKTVIGAFSARRITALKACAYLDGLKLTDLHQLERHLASL